MLSNYYNDMQTVSDLSGVLTGLRVTPKDSWRHNFVSNHSKVMSVLLIGP